MPKAVLVTYFSAGGATKRAAEEIADALGADLYEIAPAVPYTAADLDWTDKKSRSSSEMNDPACRPALAGGVDTAKYGVIFVGFPVWWYVEPRIVDSFLESCGIAGKTLIPFATSGGSGIEGAEKRLHALFPAAKWKKGRLMNGGGAAWAVRAAGE